MKVSFCSIEKTKKVMMSVIFIILLVCLFTIHSAAQTQKPLPCPTLQFVAPPYEVKQGEPLKLAVKVTGGAPNASFTYNWAVSDGTIVSGQGTEKIEVDTQGTESGTITATVEVGGLAPQCNSTRSHSTEIMKKPVALKVYEGNYVSKADLEKQIDELILARIVSQGQGYIIFYAGRKAPAGEVKRLTGVAQAQMKKNKVDAALFVIIEGGTRDKTAFELWAAGIGADPPKPTPNK